MLLGIQDLGLACLHSLHLQHIAVRCLWVVKWNKGEEPMKPEDVAWAKEEKTEVEDAV